MPEVRLPPSNATNLEGVRGVSGEYIVLRREEYEQLVEALERAVELAERYEELVERMERARAKQKRGGRK